MSRLTRLSSTTTFARFVHSKPHNVFGRQVAQNAEGPSAAIRRASNFIFANFFRRNAVFVTAVVGVAAVSTGVYNEAMEYLWEANNKGKLFKDVIKHYPNLPPNTEPEGDEESEAEPEPESESDDTVQERSQDPNDSEEPKAEGEPEDATDHHNKDQKSMEHSKETEHPQPTEVSKQSHGDQSHAEIAEQREQNKKPAAEKQ